MSYMIEDDVVFIMTFHNAPVLRELKIPTNPNNFINLLFLTIQVWKKTNTNTFMGFCFNL